MNILFDQMLKKYSLQTAGDKNNAVKEIMQEIVLCGLSRANFFDQAVFYGGTALRIFYGLDRFSEDLDFSLQTQNPNFDLETYFPILENEIKSMGLNLKIEKKVKTKDTAIESAFLKGSTVEHLMLFYSDNALIKGMNQNQVIKIKFEIDTNPPEKASFETKMRLLPSPYSARLYDMPSLFAGKIHAVLCRGWQNRVKGRDLYDYIFYLQNSAKVNLPHLNARLKQTNLESKDFTIDEIKTMLCDKFDNIDYTRAKEDVKPFIKDVKSLDIWSAEFFKMITSELCE